MTTISRPSRRMFHLSVVAATVIAWACTDDGGAGEEAGGPGANDSGNEGGTGEPGELDRTEVLSSVAEQVLAPTFAEFAEAAGALQTATADYTNALSAGGDVEAALTSAREAYTDAMVKWQVAEVMQLGPAASSTAGVGGEDLRDELYSWPSVNTCRIDQELVAGEFDQADFNATRLVNVYGLDALEYLLFNESTENTCPPQLPINQDGQWAMLGDEEVLQRRAAYAFSITSSLTTTADELAAEWATGGSWNAHLSSPSEGPYEDVSTAMDEVLRAMFYIDKVLKDTKIARPAGIRDCASDTCLDTLESQFARISKAQAIANLEGFRRLYLGGPDPESGVGFDDLLRDRGAPELADEMLADTEAAIAALEAIEGTFFDALVADGGALDEAHAAIVELTDDLKGDFPMILMLNIPTEAAGDAD